jgi:hypothetical protein
MCCPGCNGDRPPPDPPAPNPPTPVQPCPLNVTVTIRASDGTSAPCTVVPVGGTIQLRAVPSCGSGTYQWSTTSANVTLSNTTSQTVTVTALNTVSTGRGAETVQVVFTPSSGAALAPVTIGVTVIRVTFSQSTTQRYGYDNMDNAAGVLHHVSVKRNGNTTVHVDVQGGGTGDDLQFTSDDTSIAEPVAPAAGTGAAFELTINGKDRRKHETSIKAKCRCTNTTCAEIKANVYEEKAVTARVIKVYDSTSAGTTLAFPRFDVPAAATQINTTYKSPVATLTLTDFSATGDAVDVRYDLDGTGKLTLEAGGGGPEIAAIQAAFTGGGQKVIIVKDMMYIFYLETAARAGDRTITLKASYGGNLDFITLSSNPDYPSGNYPIGPGATQENVLLDSRAANVFTLHAPLANDHPVTHGLIFPAGGLGGNPIIMPEAATEDLQRWVIGHECGHSLLDFADLKTVTDNLMYYSTAWTDHKLRFKDQPRFYNPPGGNESQWELISR